MAIAIPPQREVLVTESRPEFIDEILHRICADLQLSAGQHQNAEDRYNTIGELLQDREPTAAFDPRISAQGSMLLGTTLRPEGRREYDLDLLCTLQVRPSEVDRPSQLLELVEAPLRSHGTYETMLEEKPFSRCVRVRYKDEFHLDIVPCCPDPNSSDGAILVPDRNSETWQPGNPPAYAKWFEAKATTIFAKALREAIAPLPGYEAADRKLPLQRVVQLLKRWRDVKFADNPKQAPSSIVLTTLAGLHYQGEESVYASMSSVLRGILGSLPQVGRLVVWNPVHDEDLSESWDDDIQAYHRFVAGIRELTVAWNELVSIQGIDAVTKQLATMFKSESPRLVVKAQLESVNRMKRDGNLAVERSTGRVTTIASVGATRVRSNTHFGGPVHRKG